MLQILTRFTFGITVAGVVLLVIAFEVTKGKLLVFLLYQ
jgi:hypothetical protein